jgi:hypothetical protein
VDTRVALGADNGSVQAGADCVVTIQGGNVDRFKGRTLYTIAGGTTFGAPLTVEGLIPGGNWVAAVDESGNAIQPTATGAYMSLIGMDYLAIRVIGTGGAEADNPMPDPPVVRSTLEAGLIA